MRSEHRRRRVTQKSAANIPAAAPAAGGEDGRELPVTLALAETEGIGEVTFRRLVDRFGSAGSALGRLDRAVEEKVLTPGQAAKLRGLKPVSPGRLRALADRRVRLISYGTDAYPATLHHLHRPPPVLYLEGSLDLPDGEAVAVVGTRRSTAYGRRVTRDIAGGLAARGRTIVSGMARGIDGTAHRAALDAGGETVGVLGSGLDHEYPAVNRPLYRSMRREGLLVSEFPPGEPPAPGLFPRRNRIISALADAVVVVQAGRRSGALITVRHALELGREVLAVPGPVGPPASAGVHGLLRDGAGVATGPEDVLRALEEDGEREKEAGSEAMSTEGTGGRGSGASERRLRASFGSEAAVAARLCRSLRDGPRAADRLAAGAGLGPGESLALLVRLELDGYVRSLPGGRFALRERLR